MEIQTFCDLAHSQYVKLEEEVCAVLKIKPIAKLATSFATNVTYLFENQLYPFYWTHKDAFLYSYCKFFREWHKNVTKNTEIRDIHIILGKDEALPDHCHRSQCYFNVKNEETCICGELLAPRLHILNRHK